MTLMSWLTIVVICVMGAMSPGPSLAVILQNRVQRSLRDALVASWAHASGIFIWALAASTALATLFLCIPAVKPALTVMGAVFLIYLAIRSWQSHVAGNGSHKSKLPSAWFSGLSISFLNPKIFVFFTSLFSQFVPQEARPATFLGLAMVAALVDGTWYSTFSLAIGHFGLDRFLKRHTVAISRASACLYILVAALSLSQITGLRV